MNSNPIRTVGLVIVIALIGLLAGWGVRSLIKGRNNSDNQNTEATQPAAKGDITWGISVLTFPFPTYIESFTKTEVAEAKKLGITHVRVDYIPFNPKATDNSVKVVNEAGLKVVLIIPPGPNSIWTDKKLEDNTKKYVTEIVKRYKGKVAVYQVGTEMASVALLNNGSKHGIDLKDYPADALKAATTWVKVANETLKKEDPGVLRMVNDQWVHTGFFDNYFKQGGDFDILGWNWFSDMGTDMESVVIDAKAKQTYELLDKLKSYNKPIWLTEVNRRLGSNDGNEKAQADYITTMAKYAINHKDVIKGFFVFNLLEDQAAPKEEKGYSIIKALDDNGQKQTITGHKPAFEAYQKVIKSSR